MKLYPSTNQVANFSLLIYSDLKTRIYYGVSGWRAARELRQVNVGQLVLITKRK